MKTCNQHHVTDLCRFPEWLSQRYKQYANMHVFVCMLLRLSFTLFRSWWLVSSSQAAMPNDVHLREKPPHLRCWGWSVLVLWCCAECQGNLFFRSTGSLGVAKCTSQQKGCWVDAKMAPRVWHESKVCHSLWFPFHFCQALARWKCD